MEATEAEREEDAERERPGRLGVLGAGEEGRWDGEDGRERAPLAVRRFGVCTRKRKWWCSRRTSNAYVEPKPYCGNIPGSVVVDVVVVIACVVQRGVYASSSDSVLVDKYR